MECHAYTGKIPECRHNNLSVDPMKYVQHWSHVSAAPAEKTYAKNLWQSVQEHSRKDEKVDKKKKGISELLALHTNAKRKKHFLQTPKLIKPK